MHLGTSEDTFIKAGRLESKRMDLVLSKTHLFHLLVLMDFSNSFMSSFVPRSRIKAVTERLDVYQVGGAGSNVLSSHNGFLGGLGVDSQ